MLTESIRGFVCRMIFHFLAYVALYIFLASTIYGTMFADPMRFTVLAKNGLHDLNDLSHLPK